MDSELRNGIWNVLITFINLIIATDECAGNNYYFSAFKRVLWNDFFKLQIDNIPYFSNDSIPFIKEKYLNYKWYEVYDFIEFIANNASQIFSSRIKKLKDDFNIIFERENAGYRFIDNKISPITNSIEINEIEDAINNSGKYTALKGANIHIKSSLGLISDKKAPDYRNSIKESISAVEIICRVISKDGTGTLGSALKRLKKNGFDLHPQLNEGFEKIYAYTNGKDGIRHGLMDALNCFQEDAQFMLVSCSAFVNYLIAKANKFGIKFDNLN